MNKDIIINENWITPKNITLKDRLKLMFVPIKKEFVSHNDGISEVKYKCYKGITYLYKNELIFRPIKESNDE